LYGVAQRHAALGTAGTDEAVAELHEITRRPDLLARTAGVLGGGYDEWIERQEAAVRLLLRAGADPGLYEVHRDETRQRLDSGWGRWSY
jgi:hypothetical protein